jgi:hypothetical protein
MLLKGAPVSARTLISTTLTGRLTLVGGSAFAAGGVAQLIHPQVHNESQVVGLAGHLILGFFIVGLTLTAPAFIALAQTAGSGAATKAAWAAASGTTALALVSTSSLIHGSDYPIFPPIAVVTNAAWLLGSIVLGVVLQRRRAVPTLVAVGLPLCWVAIIPLSHLGCGLIAGSYWMMVGYLLATDAIQRRQPQMAQPVQA